MHALGADVQRCAIAPDNWFGSNKISIGQATFVNRGCFFDGFSRVRIGSRCAIGMQVTFITSEHEIDGPGQRSGRLTGASIEVGDGSWIGARATILPGVRIGTGCVIAAGAVVTHDCADNGLYAGVPARRIRDLTAAGPAAAVDPPV